MDNQPGIFIVLEGADGSGKGTQFELLAKKLLAAGYKIATFDFPRYEKTSSYFVKKYLNGEYGPASSINPYTASLFYALDRYEAAIDIRRELELGKIVLCNRYVGSNMAHQGSKFENESEQRGFFLWADSLEYQLLGLPRPDLNIFLHVPAKTSYELVAKKNTRAYTNQLRDEHEADIGHLTKAVAAYETLSKLFPRDFVAIDCTKDGNLLSIPIINDKIWDTITPLIEHIPRTTSNKSVHDSGASTQKQPNTQEEIEVANPKFGPSSVRLAGTSLLLKRYLLASSGVVVHDNRDSEQSWLNPTFAKLSIIDDFAKVADIKLANRIRQLQTEIYFQLSKYLDQTIKEIELDKSVLLKHSLSGLVGLYHTEDLIISGTPDALLRASDRLRGFGLPEAVRVAEIIDKSVGRPAQNSKIVNSASAGLHELADKIPQLAPEKDTIALESVYPRNEFDVLSSLLYPLSGQSSSQVEDYLHQLSYDEKTKILAESIPLMLDPANYTAGKVSYSLDLLSDGRVIEALLKIGRWQEISLQSSSPRFGYDVPELVELASLSDLYSECFDLTLQIYSNLQSGSHFETAAYAALRSNRVRWRAEITAPDFWNLYSILKLRSGLIDDNSKQILYSAAELISNTHPIISRELLKLTSQLKNQHPSANDNNIKPTTGAPRKRSRGRKKGRS